MNEVSRFMRYVIPGLVCTFELLLALLVSNTEGFIYHFHSITSTSFANTLGLLAGGFFASGAVGYLFSNIYYAIRECRYIPIRNDHREAVKRFIDEYRYKIIIVDKKSEKCTEERAINSERVDRLSLREAWEIFNLIWYEIKPKSRVLKIVDTQIARLLDILHSLGATLIGSIIFLIVMCLSPFWWESIFGKCYEICWLKFIIVVVGWLLLMLPIFINFKITKNTIKRYYHSYLINFVDDKWLEHGKKICYFRNKMSATNN